jgi:dihydropyrimidinase
MGTTVDAMQAGQAAVETRIPLLYSEGVAKGRISAERWVELISVNPAKLMGMWPRKGRIGEGADADLVVFDPERRWTVDWRELHMSGGYSCWDGWEVTGKVRTTILRGTPIVEDERYVGSRTGGRFVPRTMLPEVLSGDFAFSSEAAPA